MPTASDEDAAWDAACVAELEAAEAALRAREAAAPCLAPAEDAAAAGAIHYGDDDDDDGFDDAAASEAGEEDEPFLDADDAALPEAGPPLADAAIDAPPAAKRARQGDIRAWLGALPPPPPAPLVQRSLRSWLGLGAPPAPPAAAPPPPRACPWYKKIPRTPFAVDAFSFGAVPGVRAYFLTHFHSDHYMGLSSKWDAGPVYCTPTTARLVARRLRVPPALIVPLELNVRTRVCGVWVTLLDANHCPGAALLLLAPAGAPPDAPLALHTGDFRASAALLSTPAIAALAGRLSTCWLDTTYCDARYAFPDQEAVLADVARTALAARAAPRRTLFVVGAYAIGKERVALALASALGCSIYADPSRAALYACFDWPDLAAALTARPEATCLHVVPIGWLNPRRLEQYLAAQGGRYDALLAFRPTGWTHTQQQRGGGGSAGRVRIVGVPYSEHSSAAELRVFVRALRPRRIIPTVGVGSAAKRAEMERLFATWLAEPG